jgi:hypothetical protein
LGEFAVTFAMPITTWKITLRRAGQAGYHYVSTHQKGWTPSVGEQIDFIVEGKTVKMIIAETFKDRSTKEGIDVFTVRVDEIKANKLSKWSSAQ